MYKKGCSVNIFYQYVFVV